MVEQGNHNPLVGGSNPSPATNFPRSILLAAFLTVVGACAGYDPGPETFLHQFSQVKPTAQRFTHCYFSSCRSHQETFVTDQEFARIRAQFDPSPRDGVEERERIGKAIALWEEIVGARTGTWRDKGTDAVAFLSDGYQLDCLDETFNTTSYLMMMRAAGLIRFHTIRHPSSRGIISYFGVPHHAATIVDNADAQRYVVDSWFFDNGVAPVIMKVETWEKGWSPDRPGAGR